MDWTKSSFCADRQCVEAAPDGDRVLVRDATGAVLDLGRDEWLNFLEAIRAGEWDDRQVSG